MERRERVQAVSVFLRGLGVSALFLDECKTARVSTPQSNPSSLSPHGLACLIRDRATHSGHRQSSRRIDLPCEQASLRSPIVARQIAALRENQQSAANLSTSPIATSSSTSLLTSLRGRSGIRRGSIAQSARVRRVLSIRRRRSRWENYTCSLIQVPLCL